MESWEFGRMVRQWRDRVSPEAVGLAQGRRRRATGLRREELAGLAGISPDYLTRIEQGRATSPSPQVIEALARALRLPDAERDLLYRLSGHVTPGPELVPSRISPSVQRLLDRLTHTPVAVFDAALTLVIANAPYEALMGETSTQRGVERNAVWRNFLGPGSRAVQSETELDDLRSGMVADLRLTAARYPADRSLTRLITILTEGSPLFAELWQATELDVRRDPARHKVINHPTVGPIAVDCDILSVAGDDLRIMIYTAEPGSADAQKLDLALVLGSQSLVE